MSEGQYTNQGYQGKGESQGGYNNQDMLEEKYFEGNQSNNQGRYQEEYPEGNQGGYNNQGGYPGENQAYNPTYQEGEYTELINPVQTINISNKIASTLENKNTE